MTDTTPAPDHQIQDVIDGDPHKIIQIILGHPDHLALFDELEYMTGLAPDDVEDCLDVLRAAGVIDTYPAPDHIDAPREYYGFTSHGVKILETHNYLSAAPVWQDLYSRTKKTDAISAHETAPRPALPDTVATALNQ